MKMKLVCLKLRSVLFVALAAACTVLPIHAAGVEAIGGEPCALRGTDFVADPAAISGIYLCEVPENGTLYYGGRVLRTGDILPANVLDCLSFQPAGEDAATACISYYTISGNDLSPESVLTINIKSGKNQPPEARDSQLETYKNLQKTGTLDVSDPDGDALTFTVTRQPNRGSVTVKEDGSFIYMPKENKIGADSFAYTATDSEGSTSEEATVRIQIQKPADKETYADMQGDVNEFEALWLRSTGLYEGSEVAGQLCFNPDHSVTRGEFLAMAMDLAGLKPETGDLQAQFADFDQTPQWVQPYLTAALRCGIVTGSQDAAGLRFRSQDPVTGAEAAVMLQNILKLDTAEDAAVFAPETAVPAWAMSSLQALNGAGFAFASDCTADLTRRDAACMLYRAKTLLDQTN